MQNTAQKWQCKQKQQRGWQTGDIIASKEVGGTVTQYILSQQILFPNNNSQKLHSNLVICVFILSSKNIIEIGF